MTVDWISVILGSLWCLVTETEATVECYSCVYVSGRHDSQNACSDPWPWYREAFPRLAKPPVETCPSACLKILISEGAGSYSTVVRTCGSPCSQGNHTQSRTTTTTCCESDHCNASNQVTSSPRTVLALLWLAFCYCCIYR